MPMYVRPNLLQNKDIRKLLSWTQFLSNNFRCKERRILTIGCQTDISDFENLKQLII